jgi:hypothetical protein
MAVIAGGTLGCVGSVTGGKYENLIDNVKNVFRFCDSDMKNSLLDSVLGLVHGILGPFIQTLISWDVPLQCDIH